MWVEKVVIENIRCFENEELIFTKDSTRTGKPIQGSKAAPYQWITLLGENGVGKSTFLQALALLLSGPEAAKELLPSAPGWVRDSSKAGRLSATLHKDDLDGGSFGAEKIRKTFSYSYFVTGDQPIKIRLGKTEGVTVYTEPVLVENNSKELGWLRTNAFASRSQGWFAVGYGAFRRLTRDSRVIIPSLAAPKRYSNFATQFNESEPLSSFEQWMVHLDYRIAKDRDKDAERMFEIGRKTITKVLPGDVKILGVSSEGHIIFDVNGYQVSSISLSDGFRSVIALAGDLIWRLLQAFPEIEDPTLQASGVVLIDELDIHLHPSWQREIAGWLKSVFPKLQFFIATHSPLVAAGGGVDSLVLKLEMKDGLVQVKKVENIYALDADQVLMSPAFGLESTHSPETQEKIDRYFQLGKIRGRLDKQEESDYEQLSVFMKEAKPFGTHPEPDSLEARMDDFLNENLPFLKKVLP